MCVCVCCCVYARVCASHVHRRLFRLRTWIVKKACASTRRLSVCCGQPSRLTASTPHIACVDTSARRRFVNQRWLRMSIGARNTRRCEFNVMRFTDRRLAKCPHGTCDFRARRNPFQANPFETGACLPRRLSIRWKPQSRCVIQNRFHVSCVLCSSLQQLRHSRIHEFGSSEVQDFNVSGSQKCRTQGTQKLRSSVALELLYSVVVTFTNSGMLEFHNSELQVCVRL